MPARPSIHEERNEAGVRLLRSSDDHPFSATLDDKRLRSEAASILGKLGGSKGGKARAANLSSTRRREIAKKAANARWKAR